MAHSHNSVKLVAAAGQHFLTSVVNDAVQLAKRKAAGPPTRGRAKETEKRLVMSAEDVAQSLREVRLCCSCINLVCLGG